MNTPMHQQLNMLATHLRTADLVNSPIGRQLNLRGINARVVQGGSIRRGDIVRKASAPCR